MFSTAVQRAFQAPRFEYEEFDSFYEQPTGRCGTRTVPLRDAWIAARLRIQQLAEDDSSMLEAFEASFE
jgi:hypothetical protein